MSRLLFDFFVVLWLVILTFFTFKKKPSTTVTAPAQSDRQPPPELNAEQALELYKSYFETFRWQVDSYWQRTTYFAAFETAAIAGCWYLLEKKPNVAAPFNVEAAFAALGFLLTVDWLWNNNKTHGYVLYWWRALETLETRLGVDFVTTQRGSRYVQYRHLVQGVPVIFSFVWLILFWLGIR